MEYTQAYENSLHFSPRFQQYAESLADQLIDRYGLHRKRVVDIGCGKGDFLALLCERGENEGFGFDPSYVPDQGAAAPAGRWTIIREFYSEKFVSYRGDLLMCRQVLEHIQSPRDFLAPVRRAAGDIGGAPVFFEVPNVLYTLRDLGIWDLIYEHCSYFSASSLARVFEEADFDVRSVDALYGGQFLGLHAVPGFVRRAGTGVVAEGPEALQALAQEFSKTYAEKVGGWREKLESFRAAGKKAVVWGSGSKGVMFLNTLRPDRVIECVVDINPRKQGMFVAGSGQKIVPPDALRQVQPDAVIIMNPLYREEIGEQLQSLGLKAEVLVA
jgi:SAM-dependent methyltransferase